VASTSCRMTLICLSRLTMLASPHRRRTLTRHTPSVTTTRASAKGSLRGFDAGLAAGGADNGDDLDEPGARHLADSKIASQQPLQNI
jgi:hypothetical protein